MRFFTQYANFKHDLYFVLFALNVLTNIMSSGFVAISQVLMVKLGDSYTFMWYPDGWGEAHHLTGLMYCADCGGKMYVHRTNNGKRVSQYTCSQYSKVPVGKLCSTQHRINAEDGIENDVLDWEQPSPEELFIQAEG